MSATVYRPRIGEDGIWTVPCAVHGHFKAGPVGDGPCPYCTLNALEVERVRLRLAVKRIFRDRREADKVAAECMAVMPELTRARRQDRLALTRARRKEASDV